MAEATESSPLLATQNNHLEPSTRDGDITSFPEITTYIAARDFFPRPIKILTKSILVTTILAFIVLLATDILISNAPFKWRSYTTGASVEAIEAYVIVTFIAAVINLKFKLPILFNFIIDIFLILNFLSWIPEVFSSYGFPTDAWCTAKYSPKEPAQPGCLDWVLAAKILIGIGGGLAAIVGVLHLVLLLMRCVAAWKSKFWRRPAGFAVPTGELTFQFTIRFLKQQSPGVVAGNGVAAASSPPNT